MHASELSQLAIHPAESDADLEAMIHVRGLVTPEAHPTVEILRFNLESNPDLVYLVARLGGEPVACGFVEPWPSMPWATLRSCPSAPRQGSARRCSRSSRRGPRLRQGPAAGRGQGE
jgi:hypothetical protein